MKIHSSKLPGQGTTIFTVMSALANKSGAVNLSQGFPDFPVDPHLNELINKAVKDGHNQYAPMSGLTSLKEGIAASVFKIYGKQINPEDEITITSGATEALFAAVSSVVNRGDEVIIFDPSYDSYVPAVLLNGGIPVRIPLIFPDYNIDWDEFKRKITEKTRLIIINSPNNPTGSVFNEKDILNLKEIIHRKNIFIVSDEVYEHIIFDGRKHFSFLLDEELYERSFIISSFGKTFHITGWKVGYCTSPASLTNEFRKIHQFLTFSTSTPSQAALSEYIKDINRINSLKTFYENKRNYFLKLISETRFKPLDCCGTYFQLLDYSAITDISDYEFALLLTEKFKVASIPVSVFYENKTDNKVLRFCFAKENATLERAVEYLKLIH